MKTTATLAVLAALVIPGWPAADAAQAPPKTKNPPTTAQAAPAATTPQPEASPTNAPPQPGWIARCSSIGRDAPLECAVEETAVLTKTGQVIVVVNIRVASDTHAPLAVVQLPLGLNLPAGARMQVDDGKPIDLTIQTCENRGCYANSPVSPELLAALKSGKQLKVSFQTLSKETVTIPMPLADFPAAYDKIK